MSASRTVSASNNGVTVCCGKTRMVWPPNVETEFRRVTDRQTSDRQADGQISCHGIIRTMHTRRAVKIQLESIQKAQTFAKSKISREIVVHWGYI